MEEFSTFQGPFSQEKMEFVMETAKANMKNNKETLLEQIHKAVLHRQRKSWWDTAFIVPMRGNKIPTKGRYIDGELMLPNVKNFKS